MDTAERIPGLQDERARLFRATRGGVSLPVAGCLYWLALGIAGFVLGDRAWCLAAFYTSGLILPLGIALQKPFGSRLFEPSPLGSLIAISMLPMALSFGISIPAFFVSASLVPLTLAIGMTVHWPIIGWVYGRPGFTVHAVARVGLVVALWALLPEYRFTAVPLAVAVVYAVTAGWLLAMGRGGDTGG